MEKFQLPPEYDTAELQKLVELFPQFFREGYFDFDEFKAYVSGIVPNDLQEKYSFAWHGKTESYRLLRKNSNGTLRPCKEDSVNWNTTKNLYIEGDNLEVLKLIKHTYAGERGVKLIYIDPPYNTSEDFIYDDNFVDSLDKYLEYTNQNGIALPETSGRYHTRWLNMMYPRLWLANYLLRDDGVIFISVDDRELANLRKLCDEVFGEENFLAVLTRRTKSGGGSAAHHFAVEHDYVVVYAKNKNTLPPLNIPFEESYAKRYAESDDDGRYFWDTMERSSTATTPYIITAPDGQKLTGKWFRSEERFLKDLEAGEVRFLEKSDGSWSVQFKQRMADGRKIRTIMGEKEFKSSQDDLDALDMSETFDWPKTSYLLMHFMRAIKGDGDIILDFFSGSATAAQAAMQLNAEDGGNRRFIMVQLPEVIDIKKNKVAIDLLKNIGKPLNICEIGKERIRRAGKEISKTHPNVDVGFRVFKLDKSNFKIWDDTPVDPKNPSEVARLMGQLEIHAKSPFIEGRSHEDIVYEIMRMNNYPLTTPIISIGINGETVYGIGEDCDFIICLDVAIDDAAAEELCKYRPGRILFTDSCFKDTETRVNVEHTIKNINAKIKLRVV